MKNKRTSWLLVVIGVLVLAALWGMTPEDAVFKQVVSWQQLTSPGKLSAAHARLEKNCAACHSGFGGINDADCIACHALDERLLGWPENIFHADIGSCASCHPEHLGRDLPSIRMDHVRLSGLILERLSSGPGAREQSVRIGQISMWLRHQNASDVTPSQYPQVRPEERVLNCYTCHIGSDIHVGLFGRDCEQCHQTQAWTIPGYRHPTGRSIDCFECHTAPKSHFRGHFKKMPGRVGDCYMCHRTPSWLDIGHPPWYRRWMGQLKGQEIKGADMVENFFDKEAEEEGIESLFDEEPRVEQSLEQ